LLLVDCEVAVCVVEVELVPASAAVLVELTVLVELVPTVLLPAWPEVPACAVLVGSSALEVEGPQLPLVVAPCPAVLPIPVLVVVEEVPDDPQLELLPWFVEREVALTFPELDPEREFDASSDCDSASLVSQ